MEAHVERMVEEFKQLADRIEKLRSFIKKGNESGYPKQMDEDDVRLLELQYGYMNDYATALGDRLYRAGHDPYADYSDPDISRTN